MAKEILIYQPIYSSTAASFINELEANRDTDIVLRTYCQGGDVYSAYGMMAKVDEHTAGKKMKVDGRADSAAAFLMCKMDDVECLSISKFTFHRAAFPSWVENDKERFTDAMKAELTTVNTDLRSIMESKVTPIKWKNVTGVSLDDMFSLDARRDVEINAEQAKKLGLVQRITALTPAKKNEINAYCGSVGIAALYTDTTTEENNIPVMEIKTLADLKATYPALCIEASNEGALAERDRVTAALVYADTDLAAVTKVIAEGKPLGSTFFAEMGRKQISASLLTGLENGNTVIPTAVVPVAGAPDAAETARLKAQSDARLARFKANNGIA